MNALEAFSKSKGILRQAGSWRRGLPIAWFASLRHVKGQDVPEYLHEELVYLGTLQNLTLAGNPGPKFKVGVTDAKVREFAYCHEAIALGVQCRAFELAQSARTSEPAAPDESSSPLAILVKPPELTLTPHERKLQDHQQASWSAPVNRRDREKVAARLERFTRLTVDISE